MKYSIAYKNSGGLTQHTEFTAFDSDPDAIAQARTGLLDNAIVEVWKGDHLLARLAQSEAGEVPRPVVV